MGRRQFETVVASAPRDILRLSNLSSTASVGPSSSHIIDLYSAPGTIGIVQSAYMYIPAVGAVSFNHALNVTTTAQSGDIIFGESPGNELVYWNQKSFQIATAKQQPSGATAQVLALAGSTFDDAVGLRFQYVNSTTGTQTGNRVIILTWIERTRG